MIHDFWISIVGAIPRAQSAPAGLGSTALLALRRFFIGLTLSPPEPTARPYTFWSIAAGLGVLLLVAIAAQGARRALFDLFDLPGHVRLFAKSIERLRNASRLAGICLLAAVLSWTGYQAATYKRESGLEDLALLASTRGAGWSLAGEHAPFAALTPLRDLFGLADMIPLTLFLWFALSRIVLDRFAATAFLERPDGKFPAAILFCWVGLFLAAMLRVIGLFLETSGLPPGGVGPIEMFVIPTVTWLADSIVLCWIVVELRNASLARGEAFSFDPEGWVSLAAGGMLASLALMPARYLGIAAATAVAYVPWMIRGTRLVWSLVAVQSFGLVFAGLLGGLAWTRGSGKLGLRGYGRLLRASGGRLVAVLTFSSAACGAIAWLAYGAMFSLPAQPWLLTAADAYAHYGTLVVGLATAAAIVELGESSLPHAKRATAVSGEHSASYNESGREKSVSRSHS